MVLSNLPVGSATKHGGFVSQNRGVLWNMCTFHNVMIFIHDPVSEWPCIIHNLQSTVIYHKFSRKKTKDVYRKWVDCQQEHQTFVDMIQTWIIPNSSSSKKRPKDHTFGLMAWGPQGGGSLEDPVLLCRRRWTSQAAVGWQKILGAPDGMEMKAVRPMFPGFS